MRLVFKVKDIMLLNNLTLKYGRCKVVCDLNGKVNCKLFDTVVINHDGNHSVGDLAYRTCGDAEATVGNSAKGESPTVGLQFIGDLAQAVYVNVISQSDVFSIAGNKLEGLVCTVKCQNGSYNECKTGVGKCLCHLVYGCLRNCYVTKKAICSRKLFSVCTEGICGVIALLCNAECDLSLESVLVSKEVFCENCVFRKSLILSIIGFELVEVNYAPTLGCVIVNNESYLFAHKVCKADLIGNEVDKEYGVIDHSVSILIGIVACREICKLGVAVKCENLACLIFNSDINVMVACTAEHIGRILAVYDEVGGCECTLRALSSTVSVCREVAAYVANRITLIPEVSFVVNTAEGCFAKGVIEDPTLKAVFKATVNYVVLTGISQSELVCILKDIFSAVCGGRNSYVKAFVNSLYCVRAENEGVAGAVKSELLAVMLNRIIKLKAAVVIYVISEVDNNAVAVTCRHIVFFKNFFILQGRSYVVGNENRKINRKLLRSVVANDDGYGKRSCLSYATCGHGKLTVNDGADVYNCVASLDYVSDIADALGFNVVSQSDLNAFALEENEFLGCAVKLHNGLENECQTCLGQC